MKRIWPERGRISSEMSLEVYKIRLNRKISICSKKSEKRARRSRNLRNSRRDMMILRNRIPERKPRCWNECEISKRNWHCSMALHPKAARADRGMLRYVSHPRLTARLEFILCVRLGVREGMICEVGRSYDRKSRRCSARLKRKELGG